MHRLVYADLTNQRLLRDLGGPQVSFPKISSHAVMRLALRFSEQVGDAHVERYPEIVELRAAIGPVDLRPEAGTIALKVGSGTAVVGTNLTTALTYGFSATDLETALNVLSVVGTAVVVEDDETFVITGIDDPITCYTNTLRPITFARIETYEVNGATTQALRLQRAPYAFTDTYDQKVPPGPSIVRVQAGGSDSGIEWNEIQKLTVPREFAGSYLLKANDEIARTGLLGIGDGPEEVAAAMNPTDDALGLAPDDAGLFIVTEHPTEPAMFIEFAGSMAGQSQDLLKVAVFDAPPGDFYIELDLNTPAMSEAFRDKDEVTAVLEIFADIQDEDDAELVHENVPVYRGTLNIAESVVHADLATPQNPDWINPPQSKKYTPVSPDALASGSRYVDFLLGNGSDVAHQVVHSLDSPRVRIHLRENTAGGRDLVPGTDYEVEHDDDDTVTITFLGDYASTPPASNAISGTAQDLRLTSSFDEHTHTIAEVDGLQTILDTYGAAIAALQAAAGNLGAINSATLSGGEQVVPLGDYFAMPGVLELPEEKPSSLSGWTPFTLEENPLDPVRLLPAVHLLAANVETLPSPLPRVSSDYAGRVFTTATARTDFPGGGLLAGDYAACDGRSWYRVARVGSETTWYPQVYELELFRFEVTEDELVAASVLDLSFGLETAIFTNTLRQRTRRTGATWTLLVEHGQATADSTPATTGSNLDTYFSGATTMLTHTFQLSEVPRTLKYGIQITRPASGSITAVQTKFFKSAAAASAPSTANFKIRARLTRFDVEDAPSDPRGLVAVRGFAVGADGQPDDSLGRYTINS